MGLTSSFLLRSRHVEVFIIIIFHPSQHSSCSYDLEVGFFHSDGPALNKKEVPGKSNLDVTYSISQSWWFKVITKVYVITLLTVTINKRDLKYFTSEIPMFVFVFLFCSCLLMPI